METETLTLFFSDHELAWFLGEQKPPKGVTVKASQHPTMRAAAGMDIVVQVTISVHLKIASLTIAAGFVAHKVRAYLKKLNQEQTKINDKKLKPDKVKLLRIFRRELHWQNVREKQYKEEHGEKQAPKRRAKRIPK